MRTVGPAQSNPDVPRRVRQVALGLDKREKTATMLAFGRKLKSLRVVAGLSQAQLANLSFLRAKYISELERGCVTPTLDVVQMLAQALDLSVGKLTDGLAAPCRQVVSAQMLALIISQPGISTKRLAESLQVPEWYAWQVTRRLEAMEQIGSHPTGWQAVSYETSSVETDPDLAQHPAAPAKAGEMPSENHPRWLTGSERAAVMRGFGRRLHKLRVAGPVLSEEELAERCGVSRATIIKTELGQREARLCMIVMLCESLEVSPDVLVAGLLKGR